MAHPGQTNTVFEMEQKEELHVQSKPLLCTDIKKKRCISAIKYSLIFFLVSSYFIYQLIRYSDNTINRAEYKTEETINSAPKPFVYVTLKEKFQCDILVTKGTNISNIQVIATSLFSAKYIDDYNDISLHFILSNKTRNDYLLITNISSGWIEYLLIPPNNDYSAVGEFWDALQITILCALDENTSRAIILDAGLELIYYEMNHKDNLYQYNTLSDIFNYMFESSLGLFPGYMNIIYYDWIVINNKIDNVNQNLYIAEIAYAGEWDDSDDWDYFMLNGVASVFSIEPNTVGIKTTTVITKLYSFYDVISLTGGMFSALSSIIGIFVIYLIWGIACFEGVAKNAYPSGIERRKFKPYVNQLINDHKRVIDLENKIKKLEQIIQKYESNGSKRD